MIGGMERYSADLIAHSPAEDVYVIALRRTQINLLWWIPYALFRTVWLFFSQRPDVIHVTDVLLTPFFVPLAKLFRIPLIATAHALDVIWPNRIYQQTVRWALPKVNHVVAVSTQAKQYCMERGVSEEHITIIPNGIRKVKTVDRAAAKRQLALRYGIGQDHHVLLSVGRLAARKNMRWFVREVMPMLPEDISLLIIGTGPEKHAIRRAVRERGLVRRVILAGNVPDDDRDIAYAGSDLFVMPNRRISGDAEGFGIVAIEAASQGLPVVTTGIEGIVEAVQDGKNGLLVPEMDAQSFAQAIRGLVEDPQELRERSLRAKEYTIGKFSWEQLTGRYRAVYEHALNVA